MKSSKNKLIRTAFLSLLLGCLCVSCEVIEVNGEKYTAHNRHINIFQGPADLTITNVSTGEFRQKVSTITININGSSDDIVFKRGNTMQLLFTPPDNYKKYGFSVNFSVLDLDVTVSEFPYSYEFVIPDDVPAGTYAVLCSAMCEQWSEGSSCCQNLTFRIE